MKSTTKKIFPKIDKVYKSRVWRKEKPLCTWGLLQKRISDEQAINPNDGIDAHFFNYKVLDSLIRDEKVVGSKAYSYEKSFQINVKSIVIYDSKKK